MTKDLPNLEESVRRLQQFKLYFRWLLVLTCWLVVIPLSIWVLRDDIALMKAYFTWSALRYTLAYRLVPSFFVFLSLGITLGVLLWHSHYIVQGITPKERYHLEKQVRTIYRTGWRHPLWKWLFKGLE